MRRDHRPHLVPEGLCRLSPGVQPGERGGRHRPHPLTALPPYPLILLPPYIQRSDGRRLAHLTSPTIGVEWAHLGPTHCPRCARIVVGHYSALLRRPPMRRAPAPIL